MALMGKPEENDQSEDIGVDGKLTLKCDWRVEWTNPGQNSGKSQAAVKAVVNFRFP
jgi:hypothetical protein